MKKTKLIIFHPYSKLGGADKSLYRLINNIDIKKFSITFVSLNKSVLKNKLNKKINFISLNASRSLFVVFMLRKIINKFQNRSNYFKDIILISNQNFANIIAFFASINLNKIKKIFIERNHLDELNYYDGFFNFFKKKIIKILMKISYKKANKIIAISKELSKDLSKYIDKPVQTIYSPSYDKDIFKLQNKKVKFNFNKNNCYLINVSRFSEYKGQMDILKATNELFAKYQNLKLILIGYGEYKKNLLNFIKDNNLDKKVFIIDNCSNPYPYIKKSNLFIFASSYEGFPNVLVEALMLNTPVISSKCKSGPSEILMNGKGGDLYQTKNYKQLKVMIENFIKNSKKFKKKMKFGKKKLWKFSLARHIKIYNKVLSKI